MSSHTSLPDDASFVVLGLGSMPPYSTTSEAEVSDQRALDSLISVDSTKYSGIQQKLDQVLLENCQLRDALSQNNLAMKTQCEALSKWQKEVSDTHFSHKQKFEETRALVIKLKAENAALKNSTGKKSSIDDLEKSNSEIFSLQRQVDQLNQEKMQLVKERDDFRRECTALTLRVSDLNIALRQKTDALENITKNRGSGKNNPESMQSWLCYEQPIARHPLSIEVDNPPVPDVHLIKLENETFSNISKSLKELQQKYDAQGEELKKNQESHQSEIEEKNKEIQKLKGEMEAKDSFLKTTVTELLQEKDKNHQLTAQCEKMSILQNQVEVYENDYKEERNAREQLATEKENMAAELRYLKNKMSEMEIREDPIGSSSAEVSEPIPEPTPAPVTENTEPQNTTYECPLCPEKFLDLIVCAVHVNECLDKP